MQSHRAGRTGHSRIIVFGVVVAVGVAGIFGVQAVQASQAAAEQAHNQAAAQAKLRAATAARQAQAVVGARAAVADAIALAEPKAAAAEKTLAPYRLSDAIASAKTLLALQSDDPDALKEAAAAVMEAQDWLKDALVQFDIDKAAEAKRAAADATKKAKAEAAAAVARQTAARNVVSPPSADAGSDAFPNSAALLAQAKVYVARLGASTTVVLSPKFEINRRCHAHATLGHPTIVIDRCYLAITKDALSDLMAHEWVHTQTSPHSILPDKLAPKGIDGAEMVADCYAMAKLHTAPAPGGYMNRCTPQQTAAAIATIEHPTFKTP